MLDALSPAITILEQSSTLDGLQRAVEVSTRQAVEHVTGHNIQVAKQCAEATKDLVARSGRASYVSRELLTQPDPGATAVGIWLQAILTILTK